MVNIGALWRPETIRGATVQIIVVFFAVAWQLDFCRLVSHHGDAVRQLEIEDRR